MHTASTIFEQGTGFVYVFSAALFVLTCFAFLVEFPSTGVCGGGFQLAKPMIISGT